MYKVVNTDFADQDIWEAAQWYEARQEELGSKFIDDIENVLAYLENNPFLYKEIFPNVYQAPLRKFPFVVLYKIKDKIVIVVAVFNCYQSPKKKTKYIRRK